MIVLVAHGTRDPAGARVTEEIATHVREAGFAVRVAFADVRQPDVTTVLNGVRWPEWRTVVVPAFLAAGYHVRTDVPAQVARSTRPRTLVSRPFGPEPALLGALCDRLRQAGYRAGDAVVLAAAGSSDTRALAEVDSVADALAARLGTHVRVGYAAVPPAGQPEEPPRVPPAVLSAGPPEVSPEVPPAESPRVPPAGPPKVPSDGPPGVPSAAGSAAVPPAGSSAVSQARRLTVAEAVAEARLAGGGSGRVAVASWLLAPGLFQRRLAESGADVVAAPLGAHPAVVDLVLRRYAEARPPASPPFPTASPPPMPASSPFGPASSAPMPASPVFREPAGCRDR